MSSLDDLKKHTVVVADTGDFESFKNFHPEDATTNPSLIFKSAQLPQYEGLVHDAIDWGFKQSSTDPIPSIMTKLFVNFGSEILKIVPGRVSTEVDSDLSFDKKASLAKAHQFIELYKEAGIDKSRILIKLASTWEGIQAAEQLESEGIHCNLTLMFSMCQAVACANAKVTLISPFVGRILDWHKKDSPDEDFMGAKDPGVKSVSEIYNYYKKYDIKTQIMGASFRNIEEIVELCGCDLLTISPALLKELSESNTPVTKKLDAARSKSLSIDKLTVDEKKFRWMLNQDAMATEKLSEGIRNFYKDKMKLEQYIKDLDYFKKK